MKFDHLRDVLSSLKKNHTSLGKRIQEAYAVRRWEAAVGTSISKHSEAMRVRDGVLWVEVDHPVWQSELTYKKNQILERLNKDISEDQPPLKDIFFSLKKKTI